MKTQKNITTAIVVLIFVAIVSLAAALNPSAVKYAAYKCGIELAAK